MSSNTRLSFWEIFVQPVFCVGCDITNKVLVICGEMHKFVETAHSVGQSKSFLKIKPFYVFALSIHGRLLFFLEKTIKTSSHSVQTKQ